MNVQEQLRALVHRHHAGFAQQLAVVERLLGGADAGGDVPAAHIAEAEDITHQMKGTAGSMGFAAIGAAAAALDDGLKELKELGGPVNAARMQDARDLLDSLRRIAERTTPEMSALYNADLSRLQR